MHQYPEASAPAPAYLPTPADLDEMARVHAVHDLLDVASDLPQEVRWALLDYAARVLGGRSTTSPRETARV